jgi:alkylation response protein AidB-like acyl-CoA dehydrogenase
MRIEQVELRDAARNILTGLDSKSVPATEWQTITDAGWLALTAPEALGGLEQPLEAACWLHLEQGNALSRIPLLPALMAADGLCACPPSSLRDAWLERVLSGEQVAASLLDPSAAGLSLSGKLLSGTVAAVQNAGSASHALLTLAAESLVVLVPLDQPGVSLVSRPLWDETRELADLVLSDLALDDSLVLARGAEAKAAIEALAVHLYFGIAADCVGAADALLQQTVEYLRTRRQFDRPLAMFQALKHRCADLLVTVAAAEALLGDRLQALGKDRGHPLALAKAAKSICSSAFRAVAEDSVQLHGGIGMTAEHPCHLYLKRALLNEHLAGPNDACDLAVAADFLRSLDHSTFN